jgi:hypothetical protein
MLLLLGFLVMTGLAQLFQPISILSNTPAWVVILLLAVGVAVSLWGLRDIYIWFIFLRTSTSTTAQVIDKHKIEKKDGYYDKTFTTHELVLKFSTPDGLINLNTVVDVVTFAKSSQGDAIQIRYASGNPHIALVEGEKSEQPLWRVLVTEISILALAVSPILLAFEAASQQVKRDEAYEALARANQWPVLINETFDSNDNQWPICQVQSELFNCNQSITNGKFVWDFSALYESVSLSIPTFKSLSDLYLTVEARLVSSEGSWENYFGFIIRYEDSSNFYAFTHSERVTSRRETDDTLYTHKYGYYRFDTFDDGEWNRILNTSSNSEKGFHPGQPEIRHPPDGTVRLAVIAEGDMFYFFMDDRFVNSAQDDQFAEGSVGLILSLPTGEEAVVEFDNFVVRAP